MRYEIALLFLLSLSLTMPSCASAQPNPATADRDDIMQVTVTALQADLGKPAKIDVKALNIALPWAFLYGKIQEPNGAKIDYRGSKYAEAAANGGMGNSYAALLEKNGSTWKLVVQTVGPSDAAWVAWASEYSAPAEVIKLPAG